MQPLRALLLTPAFLFSLFACDSRSPTPPEAGEPRASRDPASDQQILNWCDVYGCEQCPAGGCPPGLESVIHCCNAAGTCVHVELMSLCDPDDYVVICRWGQTNADGSITCYEV